VALAYHHVANTSCRSLLALRRDDPEHRCWPLGARRGRRERLRVAVAEPSASSATASAAPTPAAGCTLAQLQLSTVNTGAAAGTVGGWLRFLNISGAPCSLRGWPTVVGVTAKGAMTRAQNKNMLLDSPNVQGTPTVVLDPGGDAFAAFAGGDNPSGTTTTCPPSISTLRITPPGASGFASVSAWNVGLGAYLSNCAGLGVTMVVPRSLVPYVPLTP
jgi:Domain of unknown function (DUF4232)